MTYCALKLPILFCWHLPLPLLLIIFSIVFIIFAMLLMAIGRESMLTSTKRRKGKIEKNVSISGGQREWVGPPSVHQSAYFYNEPMIQMLRDYFFFFLQKGIMHIQFCSNTWQLPKIPYEQKARKKHIKIWYLEKSLPKSLLLFFCSMIFLW